MEPAPEDNLVQEELASVAPTRPRRIIDRIIKIARAEEDLRRALVILLVGDLTSVSVEILVAEFARSYDLPDGLFEVHRLCPTDFLVVFDNEATAIRVYNNGVPVQLASCMMHFRRWSRLAKATGVVLPRLVSVELRGIPAHAWELETAEHLLDEWCWVRELLPDTGQQRDYSVFRLLAWCSEPEHIPAAIDLVIVEPPTMFEENPPVKRGLEYPIEIAVAPAPVAEPPQAGQGPPPPPPTDKDEDSGRRRRRRDSRSPPAPSRSPRGGSPIRGKAPRLSVHARLGPKSMVEGHVADSNLEAEIEEGKVLQPASEVDPFVDDLAASVINPSSGVCIEASERIMTDFEFELGNPTPVASLV